MCETHGHRSRGHRRWKRRFPNRDDLVRALEERQKDLEQEVADIHDLLRRLRDEAKTAGGSEPAPSI